MLMLFFFYSGQSAFISGHVSIISSLLWRRSRIRPISKYPKANHKQSGAQHVDQGCPKGLSYIKNRSGTAIQGPCVVLLGAALLSELDLQNGQRVVVGVISPFPERDRDPLGQSQGNDYQCQCHAHVSNDHSSAPLYVT